MIERATAQGANPTLRCSGERPPSTGANLERQDELVPEGRDISEDFAADKRDPSGEAVAPGSTISREIGKR